MIYFLYCGLLRVPTMTTNRDMLNVYGVVAAHFVDVLYNGLYIKAENASAGNTSAVRDLYRQMVARFSSGLKQPKYCSSVLDGMSRVWNIVHPHKTQSQYMDLMLRQFLPADMIETMTPAMIDEAMFDIVRRIASLSINYVFTPKMQTCIMEMRGDTEVIEDMKNEIASFCVVTREAIHTEWAMKRSGVTNTVTVDASSLTNASRQVRALTAENNKLRAELERSTKLLRVVWAQLEEHKQQLKIQMSQSAQLESILKIMQEKQAITAPAPALRTAPMVASPLSQSRPAASPNMSVRAQLSNGIRSAAAAATSSPQMSIRAQLMAGSSVTADRPAGAMAAQVTHTRTPIVSTPAASTHTRTQASTRVPAAEPEQYTPSWTFTPMQTTVDEHEEHNEHDEQEPSHVHALSPTPSRAHASSHVPTPAAKPSREEMVAAALSAPAAKSTLSALDNEAFISEMENAIDDIMSTPTVSSSSNAAAAATDSWFDTADTILVA